MTDVVQILRVTDRDHRFAPADAHRTIALALGSSAATLHGATLGGHERGLLRRTFRCCRRSITVFSITVFSVAVFSVTQFGNSLFGNSLFGIASRFGIAGLLPCGGPVRDVSHREPPGA